MEDTETYPQIAQISQNFLAAERDTSLRVVLISKCLDHKDSNPCMKALSPAKEDTLPVALITKRSNNKTGNPFILVPFRAQPHSKITRFVSK